MAPSYTWWLRLPKLSLPFCDLTGALHQVRHTVVRQPELHAVIFEGSVHSIFRACLYPNGSHSLCVCIGHLEWGSCNSETEFSIWIDFSLNWRSHTLLVFSMSDSAVEDGDSPGVYFRGEWVSWICQSWVVTCAGDRGLRNQLHSPPRKQQV